jgi:hypothetical protein
MKYFKGELKIPYQTAPKSGMHQKAEWHIYKNIKIKTSQFKQINLFFKNIALINDIILIEIYIIIEALSDFKIRFKFDSIMAKFILL